MKIKSTLYTSSKLSDKDDEETVVLKKSFQTSGSAVNGGFQPTKRLKVGDICVFLVILAGACFAKISFLLMVSNIKDGTTNRYCNVTQPDKQLEAYIPLEQRVGWMWAIVFSFTVPELGTLIRAARICFFKNIPRPTWHQLLLVAAMEGFHVIGLAILAFQVYPNLDVVKVAMLTNCVCLVPAILALTSRSPKESKLEFKYLIDLLAIIAQLTGLVVLPLLNNQLELWYIPCAMFLVSCPWWENYLTQKSSFKVVAMMASVREKLADCRYQTYLLIAPYKIILFLGAAFFLSEQSLPHFFGLFDSGWNNHTITVHEIEAVQNKNVRTLSSITSGLEEQAVSPTSNVIFWTTVTHILCSYVCYICSKFVRKNQIHSFSMALAINLAVPVTVALLSVFCGLRNADVCAFDNILPDYIFFRMPPFCPLFDYAVNEISWLWVLWLLSQTWITRHIWMARRNTSTEQLFVTPMYSGLLVDQSIAMNCRREIQEDIIEQIDMVKTTNIEKVNENEAKAPEGKSGTIKPCDRIPQIFVCATMWHENKEEMMGFLKSVLRLDEDQCARRMARNYIQTNKGSIDPDYYDLETHIFFDDAFVSGKSKSENAGTSPLNMYVKVLISIIEEAALEVYKTKMRIRSPAKIVTPYGGRLIWTLPGQTKMIVHLKDKDKIRHKKRWSQVMYMYYLLKHRITQLQTTPERKTVIAQNTYLLALDGDIDFEPNAVSLLVGRMKVDRNMGAACGRIHPVGTGPMVWYQKFEYAIGHWLQKATEHMIGCVLCSPGCFSLYRGSALMTSSIMEQYTTKSDRARHFVQYDQGEDRWLCTLLLKQKFRVDYCAASDAYTHAPEGFSEFYNQRRRWLPSTIANILDLLADAKRVVKTNRSISMPYISYQCMQMVGTILGPGTIFLMMVGALETVFGLDVWTSFLWNGVPMAGFMAICYCMKQKYQLIAAFIISAIYSLVMLAVLVGTVGQVVVDGILAPSSMFFLAVALQIVITGLLHPQEIKALPAGLIYYMSIPSMYMLLVIYSAFNINDVSWGTRENSVDAVKNASQVIPTQGMMQKLLGYLWSLDKEKHGSKDISTNGLVRCLFSRQPNPSAAKEQFSETVLLPDWLCDIDLKNGKTDTISATEEQFWVELIEKYLKPLDLTAKQMEEMQSKLKTLRDQVVFTFVTANTLFVVAVILLELKKQELRAVLNFELEPIGLVFVLFFGLNLVIQFIAMLMHRFGTVSNILTKTDLNWLRKAKDISSNAELRGNAVEIARSLQRPNPQRDSKGQEEEKNDIYRPDTGHCKLYQRKKTRDGSNLETNFKRNFKHLYPDEPLRPHPFRGSRGTGRHNGLQPSANSGLGSGGRTNIANQVDDDFSEEVARKGFQYRGPTVELKMAQRANRPLKNRKSRAAFAREAHAC